MRTDRKKFTIVELLVVVSIIAILSSMLLPVVGKAREKAKAMSCLSNAGQIAKGTVSYAGDYDSMLPCVISGSSTGGQVVYDQGIDTYLPMGLLAIENYADPVLLGCAGAGDRVAAPIPEIVDRLEKRTPKDLKERWESRADAGHLSRYVDSAYRWRNTTNIRIDREPNSLLYDFQISASIIAAPLHNYAFGSIAYRDGHVKSIDFEKVIFRDGYTVIQAEAYLDDNHAE